MQHLIANVSLQVQRSKVTSTQSFLGSAMGSDVMCLQYNLVILAILICWDIIWFPCSTIKPICSNHIFQVQQSNSQVFLFRYCFLHCHKVMISGRNQCNNLVSCEGLLSLIDTNMLYVFIFCRYKQYFVFKKHPNLMVFVLQD